MSGYQELSKLTRSVETEGEWVDFPASPDPDPWATLMAEANRRRPMIVERSGGASTSLAGTTLRIKREPFNQLAIADHGLLKARRDLSLADRWDARRIGGAVMTSLAIALRGLLVTTTAVVIVAFLLLTNSHI